MRSSRCCNTGRNPNQNMFSLPKERRRRQETSNLSSSQIRKAGKCPDRNCFLWSLMLALSYVCLSLLPAELLHMPNSQSKYLRVAVSRSGLMKVALKWPDVCVSAFPSPTGSWNMSFRGLQRTPGRRWVCVWYFSNRKDFMWKPRNSHPRASAWCPGPLLPPQRALR